MYISVDIIFFESCFLILLLRWAYAQSVVTWCWRSMTISLYINGCNSSWIVFFSGGLHNIPVSPKSKWKYVYFVPPAAPQPAGAPPCTTTMYQSAVDPTMDINSGLVGTILICKPKSINEEQYLVSIMYNIRNKNIDATHIKSLFLDI